MEGKAVLKKIRTFDRIIIIVIFTVFILLINWYLDLLSKEYLININTGNEFSNISNGIIYFGRQSCPSCESFEPLLHEVLKEENVQIYYFDTDYFRQNNLLSEEELQAIFKDYLVVEVPILVEIENGSVINTYDGNIINHESGSYVKEQIGKFITYGNFASRYVTQYTVLIILFLISLLLMIRFLCFTDISEQSYFLILTFNITLIIILILNGSSIIKTLDLHGYAMRYEMAIMNGSSFLINIFSIIRLCFIKIYMKSYPEGAAPTCTIQRNTSKVQ